MKKKTVKYIAAVLSVTTALLLAACGSSSKKETTATETTKEEITAEETTAAASVDERVEAMNIQKVDDYLYTIEIDDYDPDAVEQNMAAKYKAGVTTDGIGGCASCVNGDFYGRNYDWNYDDEAYFVIKTPAAEGRHAVLGVAGAVKALTADVVDSGEWNDAYNTLACVTLDGINDAGLAANIHVVPTGERGITTGTNPGKEDMAAARLVRAILDNCDSVDSAIDYINSVNIYCPNSDYMKQEFHWRLADSTKTVIVELIDNQVVVLEDEKIATNFYLADFDKTEETLPEIAEGIERYNILRDNYDMGSTKEGMIQLMEKINFSQAYDLNMVPFWYSEFSGNYSDEEGGRLTTADFGAEDLSDGDLTKAGAYQQVIEDRFAINDRGRSKATDSENSWNTCYTSVYDLKNLTLTVVPQETGHEYDFSFDK